MDVVSSSVAEDATPTVPVCAFVVVSYPLFAFACVPVFPTTSVPERASVTLYDLSLVKSYVSVSV